MKPSRSPGASSPLLDLLLNSAGLTALAVPAAAATGTTWPDLFCVLGGTLALHLIYHLRCLRRPPHVRSLAGILWAPFGRIRHIVPGQTVMCGKRYFFHSYRADQRRLFWAGWWNCRAFCGDSVEYFFFDRGSTRYAVAAPDVLPHR